MKPADFHVTLLMAVSVNGMIADLKDQVPWTQPIWQNYFELVHATGALIVGRSTYDLMVGDGEIKKLGPAQIAVLSGTPRPDVGNVSFVPSPVAAVKYLKGKGLKRAIVGGGASTASIFLTQRLVDELMLDVEPLLMAQGKPLLMDMPWQQRAQLLGTKDLGGSCVRLHYKL